MLICSLHWWKCTLKNKWDEFIVHSYTYKFSILSIIIPKIFIHKSTCLKYYFVFQKQVWGFWLYTWCIKICMSYSFTMKNYWITPNSMTFFKLWEDWSHKEKCQMFFVSPKKNCNWLISPEQPLKSYCKRNLLKAISPITCWNQYWQNDQELNVNTRVGV